MKKILLSVLIASSISCSNPTTKDTASTNNNLLDTSLSKEERQNKLDTLNFTGTDGLKQGKWIENNYSKNPSEGIYKNSIKEGVWTEYYNQQRTKVKSRITFVNGNMEGAAVLFDSLSSDSTIGTYSENKFIPNSKK
jgi:antitoxin component YwqK of YwqJK toxin-antitoxin module